MFITTKDFFFSFYIDLSAVLLQYKNKFNNIFYKKKKNYMFGESRFSKKITAKSKPRIFEKTNII